MLRSHSRLLKLKKSELKFVNLKCTIQLYNSQSEPHCGTRRPCGCSGGKRGLSVDCSGGKKSLISFVILFLQVRNNSRVSLTNYTVTEVKHKSIRCKSTTYYKNGQLSIHSNPLDAQFNKN